MKPFTLLLVFLGLMLGLWVLVRHRSCELEPASHPDPGPGPRATRSPPSAILDRTHEDVREEAEGLPVPIVPGTRVTEAKIVPPEAAGAGPAEFALAAGSIVGRPVRGPSHLRTALGHRGAGPRRCPAPARARGDRVAHARGPDALEAPGAPDQPDDPQDRGPPDREGLRDGLRGDPADRFLIERPRRRSSRPISARWSRGGW